MFGTISYCWRQGCILWEGIYIHSVVDLFALPCLSTSLPSCWDIHKFSPGAGRAGRSPHTNTVTTMEHKVNRPSSNCVVVLKWIIGYLKRFNYFNSIYSSCCVPWAQHLQVQYCFYVQFVRIYIYTCPNMKTACFKHKTCWVFLWCFWAKTICT